MVPDLLITVKLEIENSSMERYSDIQVKDKNMSTEPLLQGHYEYSTFTRCDFSGIDLRGFTFIECDFADCNLSNANIHGVNFRDVVFRECKMLGLDFENCDPFGLGFKFETCRLDYSNFTGIRLKKIKFSDCKLLQVDFTSADLTDAVLENCDLLNAVFDQTILEGADLSSAIHFSINPTQNRVRKMKVSAAGLYGLVDQVGLVVVD